MQDIESYYTILRVQLKSDKPSGPYTFEQHAKETIMILDNFEDS